MLLHLVLQLLLSLLLLLLLSLLLLLLLLLRLRLRLWHLCQNPGHLCFFIGTLDQLVEAHDVLANLLLLKNSDWKLKFVLWQEITPVSFPNRRESARTTS